MTAPVFVDTNVLICAVDTADRRKHEAARAWRTELWKSSRGRISFQVLQEFFAKVTQKWPAARDDARAYFGLAEVRKAVGRAGPSPIRFLVGPAFGRNFAQSLRTPRRSG